MRFLFFMLLFMSFSELHSQELTVVKKNGKFNLRTKSLTYKRTILSINGNIGKIICSGKGENQCYDLKEFSSIMDTLLQTAENLIVKSLSLGIKCNDTVVNGYHYVWKDAVFRQKDNIKGIEYKLKVTKNLN